MMIYVNGQDIARLVLGGLEASSWVYAPEVIDIRPEQYLLGLDTWLTKQGLQRSDIGGFVLIKGPGSATALRTSHAMVNALAFALGVPIVSLEKALDVPDKDIVPELALPTSHTFALPTYTRDPNITASNRDQLKRKI